MFTRVMLFSLALSGGDKEPKVAEPAFAFKLRKPADSIIAGVDGKRAIILVTSASGIGDGTITLKAGQWPENVTLRFHHNKEKGFTNLERIHLSTDRVQIEGSVKSSGKFRFFFLDAKRTPVGAEKPAREPAGVLNVTVQERNGALEVTLPACLLIGSSELRLQWVNEFR
jgi:hypothetical protein